MKTYISCLPFFLLFFSIHTSAQTQAQKDSLQQLNHQFDFWLGKWDVYKNGTDTIVGQSHIESILDSTAIQEHYQAVGSPYKGTSLNKYNFQQQQWEQYWIDNSGLTLHLKGGIEQNKMIMGNEVLSPKGSIMNKITWSKNENDTIRQLWEQSYDEGVNWVVVFDGLYQRKED